MFTPTAKKIITEICDQCNERISQNDSKNIKKSFFALVAFREI